MYRVIRTIEMKMLISVDEFSVNGLHTFQVLDRMEAV
jgi:hypothetical protein